MAGKPPAQEQCTATSKRTGERCEAWKMKGKEVCYHHGGKSPLGAGSATFKDGSRSKFRAIFSGEALEHYERARDDPRYVELREEIALIETLILESLMEAKVGRGEALFGELDKAWTRFMEASATPERNASTAGRCLRKVGELIAEGVSRHAAQAQAIELVERKRKLSETERKRLVDQERMITEHQALAFAAALISCVKRHVRDRETMAAIHADIAALVHQDVAGRGSLPGR